MQPNFRDDVEHGSDDRIIFIGDVRRRRGNVVRQRDRHYLYVISAGALFVWGVWLVIAVNLTPSKLLSYLAFLSPLWTALALTGSVVAYVLAERHSEFVSLRASVRRGVLAATVIVGNLGMLAAHRWSLLVPLLLLAGASTVELGCWYRDHQYR